MLNDSINTFTRLQSYTNIHELSIRQEVAHQDFLALSISSSRNRSIKLMTMISKCKVQDVKDILTLYSEVINII